MALVFYYKDMLEKVMMQRTQQSSVILCYQNLTGTVTGTQLDAAHAQLLEQLRSIAFASLEFQEI